MLIATGGGARSDIWLQIKADVLNTPVAALDTEEVGAAGTAYLGGLAIGVFDKDMRLTHNKKTVYPNPDKHKFYSKQLEKYKKIYGIKLVLIKMKKRQKAVDILYTAMVR